MTEYTEAFKEQILEVVSTRKVTHGCWWDNTKKCGCPLTELARANGFTNASEQNVSGGAAILNYNEKILSHSFNMQSRFIEDFDSHFPQVGPPLTPLEICERIFAE